MRKIIKYVLLIIWMGVIYFLSSQNGQTSSAVSNGLLLNIANLLKIKEIEEFVLKYGTLIRKLAHFIEFAVLGILFYWLLEEYKINKIYSLAILFCVICATGDEIHQLFINERCFSVLDIILDSSGSIFSLSLFHLARSKCYQEKKH